MRDTNGNLIQPLEKDLNGIIRKANSIKRSHKPYERNPDKYNIPKRARFKLRVFFLDGNAKSFYSYDLVNGPDGKYILDESEGLQKLMTLVNKFSGKFKTALIYATLDRKPSTQGNGRSDYNADVGKFTAHASVLNPTVVFSHLGKHCGLNINKLDANYFNSIK